MTIGTHERTQVVEKLCDEPREAWMSAEVLEQVRTNNEKRDSEGVVVLLSGGIDSTVLMYSLVGDYRVWPLTVDYGQRHSKEVFAARNVCEARGSWLLHRWKYLDLGNLRGILPSALTGVGDVPEGKYDEVTMSKTVVPNRNAILLSLAYGYAMGIGAHFVAYAPHSEDHFVYRDCRPEFFTKFAEAEEAATGIKLLVPFGRKTKVDIIKLGRQLVVPFRMCYSCYAGGDVHCGKCSTCVERREAFKKAGVTDPTIYEGGNSDGSS